MVTVKEHVRVEVAFIPHFGPCGVDAQGQNGEYDVKDIYAGVPVIIGKKGVEKIIELELSKEEKDNFNKSIEAVKVLFEAAKRIDASL